jgi:hypothetical protein
VIQKKQKKNTLLINRKKLKENTSKDSPHIPVNYVQREKLNFHYVYYNFEERI